MGGQDRAGRATSDAGIARRDAGDGVETRPYRCPAHAVRCHDKTIDEAEAKKRAQEKVAQLKQRVAKQEGVAAPDEHAGEDADKALQPAHVTRAQAHPAAGPSAPGPARGQVAGSGRPFTGHRSRFPCPESRLPLLDRMPLTTYDVIITGGGLAGLCLARQLRQEHPDLTVLVAEKKKHPVPEAAHKVGESSVEIGAHYFSKILGPRDRTWSSASSTSSACATSSPRATTAT